MKLIVVFLLTLVCFFRLNAQNLTLNSTGQTGTFGSNWMVSGSNPVKISSNNTANVNVSVIQSYLNSGVDVIISSTGNVVINNDITKNSSGRLMIKSGSNSIVGTGKIVLGSNAQLLISQGATISNNIEIISGNATIGFAPIEIEYLIVAGGASGGVGRGGGGGAGGVLTGAVEVSSGTYSITVGAGGAAVTNDKRGINGSNSSAFNLSAIGGGAGGGWISGQESGLNGGSGGGGSASPFTAGSGTAGQGNNGFWLNYYREPGGGGGGAGAAATSQNGGVGILSNITGNSMWIAGGGGAGAQGNTASLAGIGGTGGGGNGTKITNGTATNGLANTGGGGGGSEGYFGVSGAGGSGVVVLRYLGSDIASGGIEYAGSNLAVGYQVYEFKDIVANQFILDANLLQGTINGQISGSGNLILNPSSGILTVLGANSYTGTTTIQSGTVQVGNNGTQGSLGSGGVINSGKLTINKTNSTSILGAISGSGSIVQQGSGVLVLTQNNTYSGTTTISAGAIQLGDNSTSGSLGTGTLINNGNLIFKRTDNVVFNNTINGTGAVTKENSNRVNLMTANTYSGGTTVTLGTLAIYNSSSLGTGNVSMSSNSTLLTGRGVATLANNIALNGNATISLDNEVEVLLVGGGGGASSGGGGGGGVVNQTVSATSGVYTITVGAGGAGGVPSHVGANGSNGGNTSFNGITAFGGGGGGRAMSAGLPGASGGGTGGDATFAGGTATQGFPGGSGPSTAAGTAASGGGGAGSAGISGYTQVAYNALYGLSGQNTMGGNGGNGILNSITGTNVYYAGGGGGGCNNNNITQAIERAGQGGLGGGGRGGNGDNISGLNGTENTGGGGGGGDWNAPTGGNGGSGIAIIRYRGPSSGLGGTITTGSGLASGYTLHTFTTTGNNTFTLNGLSVNLTGVISGANAISFQPNDGTITLSGNNSYTGNTSLSNGTLILNSTGTLNSGVYNANISNAGIFRMRSTTNHLFSGIISGTGEIIKETTNTILKLTGTNTYSGSTTISNGTIQIGDNTTTGSFGTGNIINNNSISVKRTNDLTINNMISGTGILIKENSSVLTLTQNNTYSGNNNINGGTLVLQNNAPNPISKVFNGTGQLIIEPASSAFTTPFSTSGWTFNTALTGLTIGKPSNDAAITIASTSTIAGPISIYGGTVTLNDNIESSNGSTITLLANTLNFASGKTVKSLNGQLVVAPQSTLNTATIGLAGATGTLSLPESYFSTNFVDGFSNIQIGTSNHTGAIATNSFTLRDNMSFVTSGSLTLGFKPVLGTNNVTLGSAISSIIGTPTNYFQTNGTGKVIRTIPTGSNLLFPIGNTTYNPLSIKNNTGTSDVFSANVINGVYLNGASGTAVTTPVVNRTWNIFKATATNTSPGVDFEFGWNANEVANGSLVAPKMNHYTGSVWEVPTVTSTTFGTNTLTVTGYTGTFSPFAISEGTSALPVELTSFNANCTEKTTTINWQTASEHQSAYFELEKSRDGANWTVVETVAAAGHSTSILDYTVTDKEQLAATVYYRLNQVDQDGASKIYGPISAQCGEAVDFSASVFPNPTSGELAIEINNAIAQNVTIQICGTDGKVLVEGIYTLEAGTTQLPFNLETVNAGMYTVKVQGESATETIKLLVK